MIAPFKDMCGKDSPDFGPHKLWSLWDMLRMSAKYFIELGERVADISTVLFMADIESRDDSSRELQDDERETMRENLIKIRDLCSKLDLPVAAGLISERADPVNGKRGLPKSQGEFDTLIDAVKLEIRNKLFLFVPSHLAKYYEADLLSDQAKMAFPLATNEMRSAGNCMAAGLNTACVFHCMRAVEHSLKALANDVGITIGTQQWQNVIDQIEAEIKNLGKTMKAGTAKTERLQFLSEASAGIRNFKDAWRNHVMHTRASYDESQATTVVDHVRIFIEALSGNLKEVV